jgi:hypothetical protein
MVSLANLLTKYSEMAVYLAIGITVAFGHMFLTTWGTIFVALMS